MIIGVVPTLIQPLKTDTSSINTQKHYKGSTSIYKVAEDFELNSYEFDIIKRILRCRHKGSWLQDLQKTKEEWNLASKNKTSA